MVLSGDDIAVPEHQAVSTLEGSDHFQREERDQTGVNSVSNASSEK